MALARCILGKFLGVGCHFFPPPLDVPTFSARCLHVQQRERPPAAEGGTLRGREMFWHAANLQRETDGFTSPPKEGVLRIFSPLKIRQLWLGLNPRTWVPKASTLPPDHPSLLCIISIQILYVWQHYAESFFFCFFAWIFFCIISTQKTKTLCIMLSNKNLNIHVHYTGRKNCFGLHTQPTILWCI